MPTFKIDPIDLLDDLAHSQACCLEGLAPWLDVNNPWLLDIIIIIIIIIMITDLLLSIPTSLNNHPQATPTLDHIHPRVSPAAGLDGAWAKLSRLVKILLLLLLLYT